MSKNKKTKIIYQMWGCSFNSPPTNFEKGLWMIFVIVGFPIWCWFYLIYILICFIGELDGKIKKVEVEVEEEKQSYY